ncbi:MAG: DNA-directed RNA polymerase subunit omega [Corynebacterium sp.]|nr:DNA-directed RNA polymerase subunit omega [Corynebacterium sp.]
MTNVTTPNSEPKPEPVFDQPVGITSPPIDELLAKVSSKYALAIFAAKRARQINSYYQEQNDSVFEFVGPLVTPEAGEKPLSIALREIDAELLDHEEGK